MKKKRNPIAKALAFIRKQIMKPKKGKGSYTRKKKGKYDEEA